MAKEKKPGKVLKKVARSTKRPVDSVGPTIYTLNIFLISGPIARAFVKKNPVISRTIQIRGDQTLADLHEAIFEAYNRFDAHMYEFQLGKGPMDGPRYVLPTAYESDDDSPAAGLVNKTKIDSLRLKKDQSFGYWFDFGDDWWHQIDVEAIEPAATATGTYPKITKRVGKSPPQYPNSEE